jgi:hypothetical protein
MRDLRMTYFGPPRRVICGRRASCFAVMPACQIDFPMADRAPSQERQPPSWAGE